MAGKPQFTPNENAVKETAEHMTTRKLPGGGTMTLDDACWWAHAHAFSYDRHENGHKFWRAVYNLLDRQRKGKP